MKNLKPTPADKQFLDSLTLLNREDGLKLLNTKTKTDPGLLMRISQFNEYHAWLAGGEKNNKGWFSKLKDWVYGKF
jgi:hypothetical protein